jgi:glycosyltransferase involved in cell wall biosynthesis
VTDGRVTDGRVTDGRLGSVVIPAHDEAGVIERCLTTLLKGIPGGALEVVVVCNGCTDDTAEVVRATGLPVRVVEVEEASKITALRTADDWAQTFPRLYLDADVTLPGPSAVAVLRRLSWGDVLAARPNLRYDLTGCSWLVRRYYGARVLIPGMLDRLWGAGVYGLSQQGRARFGTWPDLTGDDLFVDSLFTDDEIEVVRTEPVVVSPPRTARDLLAVLRRGTRAKTTRQRGRDDEGRLLPLRHSLARTVRGLIQVAARRPGMMVDVLVYAGFAVWARACRTEQALAVWERDRSSRVAGAQG